MSSDISRPVQDDQVINLVTVLFGAAAIVMRRLAVPLVGGLTTSTFLTLEIIPVVYLWWRAWELKRAAARAAVTKG